MTSRKPRNKFEKKVWDSLKRQKVDFRYENLRIPYIIEAIYIPDFELPNGIIIELKGKFDAIGRRKMIAVKKAHPDLDIRFVFYRATAKIGKGSKMTHAMWAEKYGFPWAEQSIPKEWINE